jgi:hypothetical protein
VHSPISQYYDFQGSLKLEPPAPTFSHTLIKCGRKWELFSLCWSLISSPHQVQDIAVPDQLWKRQPVWGRLLFPDVPATAALISGNGLERPERTVPKQVAEAQDKLQCSILFLPARPRGEKWLDWHCFKRFFSDLPLAESLILLCPAENCCPGKWVVITNM